MTYNFDPDKWYADESFLIQSKLKTREIKQNEYDEAVDPRSFVSDFHPKIFRLINYLH